MNGRDLTATLVFLLALGLSAVGCVIPIESANFTPLNPAPRALKPKPVGSVEIHSSGAPTRPHVDVGLIEGHGAFTDIEPIVRDMQTRAAQAGCDALVIGPVAYEVSGSDGSTFSTKRLHGTCVVYTDSLSADLRPPPPQVDHARPVERSSGVEQQLDQEGDPCRQYRGPPRAVACNNHLVCREGRCVRRM
jgi:hypothetical protein